VLGAFTAERAELGATELALITGLDRTSIHRLLTTLAQIGVLEYVPQARKYRLGLRLLDYSFALLDSMELLRVAVPHLLRVQRNTGKVVTMGVPDGGDVLIIERFWGQDVQMRLIIQTGTRFPMYAGAMGHCFMAFQPESVVRSMLDGSRLEPRTPNTVTDPSAMLQRLDQIRYRGFEIADEELFLGARAVAVPIWSAGNQPVAAVALMADVRSTTVEDLTDVFAPMLMDVGADISLGLGSHRLHTRTTMREPVSAATQVGSMRH
jgi:IclR family pca regulon transcriptional regulator